MSLTAVSGVTWAIRNPEVTNKNKVLSSELTGCVSLAQNLSLQSLISFSNEMSWYKYLIFSVLFVVLNLLA